VPRAFDADFLGSRPLLDGLVEIERIACRGYMYPSAKPWATCRTSVSAGLAAAKSRLPGRGDILTSGPHRV
jgi:hypothetical protein